MKDLETIVSFSLWILYGVFVGYQHEIKKDIDELDRHNLLFFSIIFSPLILIYRILRGIFHRFH